MACILADLDMDAGWAEADERERRVFVENLLAWIKVFPDHLEVKVVCSQDQRPALRGWTIGTGECWCRRADANPHANRSDLNLKMARQIEDCWVLTGLIVGLIFLQHHETRTTADDIVSVRTWTTSTRPTRGNHRLLPLNQQVPGSSPGRRTVDVSYFGSDRTSDPRDLLDKTSTPA